MASAQDIANRIPITGALMLATLMNTLDQTIANVALPHIQGSVSASQDQIVWVLTSYIIATAIMTPLSGWLSQKIGRKTMFLWSIAGFTAASILSHRLVCQTSKVRPPAVNCGPQGCWVRLRVRHCGSWALEWLAVELR